MLAGGLALPETRASVVVWVECEMWSVNTYWAVLEGGCLWQVSVSSHAPYTHSPEIPT